ncbi:Cell fate regulator YlbF, YheA/YmcA/DUF963 family (controls sporulation, competence, biofilm development) [Pilibacter termitis]|uniref:Cell fate regulator YlbF, YheA/YmcA/DUF963 family (Controls sporulation, competence, biofilm development) n=1 Tax=Pilibacter termitis TaxID=263852 RepID=A0A1T4NZV7_9ENTE|nr:YlbF family regulator [Pilibacter termitis]SJZ84652.1 Cell fate regulator YlbF, YheA/YmcA/DUF963 family (controls sporulation, competence, biofilm development) [Pilibacter termitis]
MIITENYFELMDNVELLCKSVKNSTSYQNYIEKKQKMNENKEVQQLKNDFLQAREKFDQIKDYGTQVPDFRTLQMEAQRKKRELDLHECVAAFRFAETELQAMLDEISEKIAQNISSEIQVEAGNPFFDKGERHKNCVRLHNR